MSTHSEARLVRKSEIKLWNELTPQETAVDDPIGGHTGQSGAAAYNFLLLATSGRIWMQVWFKDALKDMTNHNKNSTKPLSLNKDHIQKLIENPQRRVSGIQPPIGDKNGRFQVNPRLHNVCEVREFKYLGAARVD